jgi:hypothetical protein
MASEKGAQRRVLDAFAESLFNRYRFCQVARLIHVATAAYRNVIGQQL